MTTQRNTTRSSGVVSCPEVQIIHTSIAHKIPVTRKVMFQSEVKFWCMSVKWCGWLFYLASRLALSLIFFSWLFSSQILTRYWIAFRI